MHLPGVLVRKGRWIPPHASSPACAREHGDTPLCPSSVPPALPCPQDPAGWNLAILAPLNTGTPSPRTAGADTHSCCLSRLSVKPHLGKGRGRQWGSITQCSRVQGSGCPTACYWNSFLGGVHAPGPHPGGCHLLCWWLQLLLNAHINLGCIQRPLALRLGTLGTESPADLCGHHCATVVPEVPLSDPPYPLLLEQQQLPVPDDEVALLELAPQKLGGLLAAFQQPTLGGLALGPCPVEEMGVRGLGLITGGSCYGCWLGPPVGAVSLTCEEAAGLADGDLPHQQVRRTGLRELAPLQRLLQHLLLGVQGPL